MGRRLTRSLEIGAFAVVLACGTPWAVWAQDAVPVASEQTPDQRLATELETRTLSRVEAQDWAGADALLVQLIEVEIRLYGPDSSLLANSWGFRAGLAEQMGDADAADRFYAQELAIRERIGDPLELARARVRAAQGLLARGRSEDAEAVLVQAMTPAVLPPDEQIAMAEALIEMRRGAGRTRENEQALRARVAAYEAQGAADRTILARARHDLAIWLRTSGRAADAEPSAREAWTTYVEVQGATSNETVIIAENLGLVLAAAGRRAEGEVMLRSAVEAPGATPGALARRLRSLAGVVAEDRPAEAAVLYRRVLEVPTEASATLRALDWARLAGALGRSGDWTGAVEARREAVTIRRQGDDQAALFRELVLMAEGQGQLGRFAESYAAIDEAWTIRHSAGLSDAERLYALWQLSTSQLNSGRPAEAEQAAIELVAARRAPSADMGWLVLALQAQAAAQGELGKFEEADAALIEARTVAAAHPGNLSVPLIDNARANLLNVQGRFDEAQALYHAAIERLEQGGPGQRNNLALVMGNLAESLEAAGRPARALDLYLEAVAIARQQAGGEDTARLLALELSMGGTYSILRRREEAAATLTSVAERSAVLLGATHPTTMGALREGALVLVETGRADLAEPVLRGLVSATAERYGPQSYQMIEVHQLQAFALYMLGRHGEAVKVMRDAEAVADLYPTRWPRLQIDVRANLAQALLHDGQLDEALPVLREAVALAIRRRGDGLETAGPGLVLNRPFQWTVRAAWEAAH